MEADAVIALIENLKLLSASIEKVSSRIDVLENDYRERFYKKKLFKWLFTVYPVVIGILLFIIDADHHKIAEVASDVKELVSDVRDLNSYSRPGD